MAYIGSQFIYTATTFYIADKMTAEDWDTAIGAAVQFSTFNHAVDAGHDGKSAARIMDRAIKANARDTKLVFLKSRGFAL